MTETVLSSLNSALKRALATDESVYILGEDILDPYGGSFKVTRGLSSAYPNRIIPSPISEAGLVGLATGMALRGLRPVVEIMFGDFLTLAADQIINHLSKFRWMYNNQVSIPLIIRTPMGGRRGYGPTHSQTLEKHFLGVPGLRVLAPTSFGDPGELLFENILNSQDPVLFIENKLLYPFPLKNAAEDVDFELTTISGESQHLAASNPIPASPVYKLAIGGAPAPVLTLVAYGYMAELGQMAMRRLAYEYEVFAEMIILTQLAPFDLSAVANSVSLTSRLLTLEEGSLTLGWGAEVISRLAESLNSESIRYRRLAAKNFPIPASSVLEKAIFPSEADIVQAGLQLTGK